MGKDLLYKMIYYCDKMYNHYQCDECTGNNCNHDCKECLDDIHFHRNEFVSSMIVKNYCIIICADIRTNIVQR